MMTEDAIKLAALVGAVLQVFVLLGSLLAIARRDLR
jgi:hypothetical protein